MDKASDILKRVRRIELRARHLATENFAGQYQSGFRGQGLDFDDFREYMPGDDPRFIDWKVTARMNSPFVRRFREEREQAVILAVDVSGSMHYASSAARVSKLDYAAEVAAVLAYSAAQSGDKCGLLIYGNSHSHYIPPAKGVKQTLRIVREIVASKNDGTDQNISDVARQLVLSQKKAAMVIMISDFWGENNKAALGQINFKHDFIPAGCRTRHPERSGNWQKHVPEPFPSGCPGNPRQRRASAPREMDAGFPPPGHRLPGLADHGQLHASPPGPFCQKIP